jgi:SEC-C motif domain protein
LKSSPQAQWIGLQVKSKQQQDEDHATVEFVARYKLNGRAYRMQEISRFVREGERWFYVDGEQT